MKSARSESPLCNKRPTGSGDLTSWLTTAWVTGWASGDNWCPQLNVLCHVVSVSSQRRVVLIVRSSTPNGELPPWRASSCNYIVNSSCDCKLKIRMNKKRVWKIRMADFGQIWVFIFWKKVWLLPQNRSKWPRNLVFCIFSLVFMKNMNIRVVFVRLAGLIT